MSNGAELLAHVDGIVHEDTQVHDRGLDLTVSDIAVVEDPGRVDFGGGELEDAELSSVPTELRNPDDDYEWWYLQEGEYLLSYNEELNIDDPVTLQTRTELRQRGASHPTLDVTELGWIPLSVVRGGIYIKENARVSTLLVE